MIQTATSGRCKSILTTVALVALAAAPARAQSTSDVATPPAGAAPVVAPTDASPPAPPPPRRDVDARAAAARAATAAAAAGRACSRRGHRGCAEHRNSDDPGGHGAVLVHASPASAGARRQRQIVGGDVLRHHPVRLHHRHDAQLQRDHRRLAGRARRHLRGDRRAHAVLDAQHAFRVHARFPRRRRAGHRARCCRATSPAISPAFRMCRRGRRGRRRFPRTRISAVRRSGSGMPTWP